MSGNMFWHLAYALIVLVVLGFIARVVANLIINRRPLPGRTTNFVRTVVGVVILVALLIAAPGVWGVFKIPTPSSVAASGQTTPLASDNPVTNCTINDKVVGKYTAEKCEELKGFASLIPPAPTPITFPPTATPQVFPTQAPTATPTGG